MMPRAEELEYQNITPFDSASLADIRLCAPSYEWDRHLKDDLPSAAIARHVDIDSGLP